MKKLIIAITLTFISSCLATEVIPGLEPVDVYLNLEKKGFKTTKHYGDSQNTFVCELEEDKCSYTVTAYTPAGSANSVKTVQVMAQWFGPNDDAATDKLKPFMGFAATFPYDGATPEEARRWVEANLGKETSESFGGGVKFELFSKARTRLLRISMDAPEPAEAATSSQSPPNAPQIAPEAPETARRPALGQTFTDIVAIHGAPSIKDPDTGWAWWKTFKIQFTDGKATQIETR
jgi:hypothetical protein